MKFFSELVDLFRKYELPWKNMVGFVSDGALAMIGKSITVLQKS
jgi:hypothetical protein